MKLCKYCNERNGNKFESCEDEECYICEGMFSKFLSLLENIKIPEEWRTFSLITLLPKKMLIREEEVWHYTLGKSIKSEINAVAKKKLSKQKPYSNNADGIITISLIEKKITFKMNDLFIFGKYKKNIPGLSQSRWECKRCRGRGCRRCDNKGKMYESIEEIMEKEAKQLFNCSKAILHSSGREDVDATNSAGRAFVLEIKEPKKRAELKELEKRINENESITVSCLHYVGRESIQLVSDSHFDKTYRAEADIEITEEEKERIERAAPLEIEQKTPRRVMHRRTDKTRKRKIFNIKVERMKPLILKIEAEAGSYIKEFISGDGERTKPSISSILNRKTKCIKLEVIEIKDNYLEKVLGITC